MDRANFLEDAARVGWSIGWIAFSRTPWRIAGPFPDIEEAERARETLGLGARIAYGERVSDEDFLPRPEPTPLIAPRALLWMDDPAVTFAYAPVIEAMEVAVFRAAACAREAALLAAAHAHDLILLAHRPGAPATALARRLHADRSAHARVVLLSYGARPNAFGLSVVDAPLTARALRRLLL